MNCVSLDTIGIAGFGHDFGALRGENGIVEEAFDTLSSEPPKGINAVIILLAAVVPSLLKIPTRRRRLLIHLNVAMQSIAKGLLLRTKKDAEAGTYSTTSRSIMGALSKCYSSFRKPGNLLWSSKSRECRREVDFDRGRSLGTGMFIYFSMNTIAKQ